MMHVVSQTRSTVFNMYLRVIHFHLLLFNYIDIPRWIVIQNLLGNILLGFDNSHSFLRYFIPWYFFAIYQTYISREDNFNNDDPSMMQLLIFKRAIVLTHTHDA